MEPKTYTASELLRRYHDGSGRPTIIGEEGGRVRVTDIWQSDRMFGYVILATEFGLIYADSDTPFRVTP